MIDEYDLNVYGHADNVVMLTAYRQAYNSFGEFLTDTNPRTTFSYIMTYPENKAEIAWLLQVMPNDLDRLYKLWGNSFADYDEWVGIGDIVSDKCPRHIVEWLVNLPKYERRLVNG